MKLTGESCHVSWSEARGIQEIRSAQFEASSYDSDVDVIRGSCEVTETLDLTFSTGLSPFVDELGGYGSDLYEQLSFFEIPLADDGASDGGVWFGWQNRYELEAVKIVAPDWEVVIDEASENQVRLKLIPGSPSASQVALHRYSGLRDKPKLETLGLGEALLFGMWAPFRALCQLIWSALVSLHLVSGSWGLAIILLALLVRIFTIPVTKISMDYQRKAIEQQARLAPKVEELKRTATGIELSEKMVALYEDESYDHLAPFKGMLGLFIQIPILIALFSVIGEMSVLRDQAFLWISDLSLSDRLFGLGVDLPFFGGYFNLLPWMMALTTILSTWVAGLTTDAEISTGSLYGMALLFFVFFYSFPAALVLYWFASNFFQMLHQLAEYYLKR